MCGPKRWYGTNASTLLDAADSGIQLDRRAPWDRSTSLRFCLAQSRRHTDGLSRRANRYSSYAMSPSPDTAAGATPKLTLPPGRGSYDSANVAHSRRLSVEAFEFCGLDPPVGGRSHDDGTIGYEVLPEADHPNHFTVIEEWTTSKSRDAHLMAAHTRAFRERLLPKEGALYDARLYNELN